MVGDVGHAGVLTNPRPWHGRCQAGYSNTGGPPLPRKRAPFTKKYEAYFIFKNQLVYLSIMCILKVS